ncbi:MAG: succinylglutamate desuccinylase/aspartoacylase family protein [Candidatus Colwellbacteria bacterium]|nr:succinylglutamate desuccinylase/aspartoacylase family protein [Candidatus Colwellbacteria bacterium]
MIKKHTFTSNNPGPTVLIFGAIHGNEVCGAEALNKLAHNLSSNTTHLLKGRLIMVPVANPKAFEHNTRYANKDLNRVFKLTKNPKTYEEKLSNELCRLVGQSDFLLDIHSLHTEGKPFVFLDDPSQDEYAKALGIHDGLSGWPELYENNAQHSDTIKYALSLDKRALLLECGSHKDPKSIEVAYNAVNNLLGFLDMTTVKPNTAFDFNNIRMQEIFTLKHPLDKLVKKWQHLDPIKRGDLLANAEDGPIVAKYDGFVIMPNHDALVGDEWFYLGKQDQKDSEIAVA